MFSLVKVKSKNNSAKKYKEPMNPIDSALAQSTTMLANLKKDSENYFLVEEPNRWWLSGSLSEEENLYKIRFSWETGNGRRSYTDFLPQEIAVNRIAICILSKEKKHPEVLKFSASIIRDTASEREYHTSLYMIFDIFKSLYYDDQEKTALDYLSSLDRENPYFSYSLRLHLLDATNRRFSKPISAAEAKKYGISTDLFTIGSDQRIRLVTSTANKSDFIKEVNRQTDNSTSDALRFYGMDIIGTLENSLKEKAASKY